MTAITLPAPDASAEEWCPSCGAPEIDSMTPRTVYACGSSDYDGRPGTFAQKCEPPTAEESGRLAVNLPTVNAPAEEWGRLAVSIPGWRWLPGMVNICYSLRVVAPQLATSTDRYRGQVSPPDSGTADGWCRAWVINYDPDIDDQMCDSLPDPDDPATAGCFLELLGGNTQVQVKYWPRRKSWEVCVNAPDSGAPRWGDGSTLGRAAIAAAAALGRWPGGGA